MAVYRWRSEFDLPGAPVARPLELGPIRLTPEPRDERGQSRSSGYFVLETERSQAHEAEAEALSRLELVAMAAASLGGSVRAPVIRSVQLENRDALEAAGCARRCTTLAFS